MRPWFLYREYLLSYTLYTHTQYQRNESNNTTIHCSFTEPHPRLTERPTQKQPIIERSHPFISVASFFVAMLMIDVDTLRPKIELS